MHMVFDMLGTSANRGSCSRMRPSSRTGGIGMFRCQVCKGPGSAGQCAVSVPNWAKA